MEASDLKQYIYENDRIEDVLTELGCHSITPHRNFDGAYYTCGNPDGDNKNAMTVYIEPSLSVKNYTRNIVDKYGISDIISLTCFIKGIYYSKALQWLCSVVGLDYYKEDAEDLPDSLQWLKEIKELNEGCNLTEEDKPLQPISEKILDYYLQVPNDIFEKDGISLETQEEFQIGIDMGSYRITIPIRDELGKLVGIKGRLYKTPEDDYNPKYMYIEPCNKSAVLFGLWKTLPFIQKSGIVYVAESEKAVMQLWSYGVRNAVSIGGHKLSKIQVEKLTRLGVEICICYDQDVSESEVLLEKNKFIKGINMSYISDKIGILFEKESPTDERKKWERLIKECKFPM